MQNTYDTTHLKKQYGEMQIDHMYIRISSGISVVRHVIWNGLTSTAGQAAAEVAGVLKRRVAKPSMIRIPKPHYTLFAGDLKRRIARPS